MISQAIQDKIDAAFPELRHKTIAQINVETARVWTGRACAAAHYAKQEPHKADAWMTSAHEYAHEAVEHAALTGDNGLLGEVQQALLAYGIRWWL